VATLRFEELAHEYYLDDTYTGGCSLKLPGVTSVIDHFGLISDYGKQQWAALRGTYIHEAAHYLFENRLDWSTIDAAIRGYLVSLQLWVLLTGFFPEQCEFRLWHEVLLFAGTIDVKGHTREGSRFIIDLKSGVQEKWHEYQTGGYLLLHGGFLRRGCLYLQQDGSIARFREHKDYADVSRFVSMLNTYRLQEEANK